MTEIYLIAHNLRSAQNVGSLLRTAEGLGVKKVYLSGYTPYPKQLNDTRLPHQIDKIDHKIKKTSLGAEKYLSSSVESDIFKIFDKLKQESTDIVCLEQTKSALNILKFVPPKKIALVVGNEVDGIEQKVLDYINNSIFIPMYGRKESFNVVQAAAMALFYIRTYSLEA